MNHMEKIVELFWNKYKFRIETKTSWNRLASSNIPEDVTEDIRKALDFEGRRTEEFTVEKQGDTIRPYRPEEALERLILRANPKCTNQHNLKQAKKENIDLVYTNENSIEIVELKPWNCKNPPIYGLIEIVKNEFFYKPKGKEISLTFLAPKAYYIDYSKNKESVRLFLSIAKASNVKVAYIDLPQDIFLEKVSAVAIRDIGKWEPENRSRSQKVISFLALPEKDDILTPLRHENWVVIQHDSQWPTA